MECSVCCEKYSNSTTSKRYKVTCNYCNYTACRSCVQRYIVESPNDPKCMSCNKEWNHEFLCSSLQKTFMNKDYPNYRKQVLLEKEKSMLPDTQKYAEQLLKAECKMKEIEKIKKQIAACRNSLYKAQHELYVIDNSKPKENKDILHRICPLENCKGFIGKGWVCGICKTKICKKCHVPFNPGDYVSNGTAPVHAHECKKEDLDNATMIMKNTKPCPKCAVLIFKIDGCDQMFCSNCHTAFGWRSGIIETGVIHNPHYYELLRRTQGHVPRNPLDIPNNCNVVTHQNFYSILTTRLLQRIDIFRIDKEGIKAHRIPQHFIFFNDNIRKLFNLGETEPFNNSKTNKYSVILQRLYIMATHIQHEEIPNCRVNNHDINRDLRVKYLLNRIEEKEWKTIIQRREKKNMRKNEIFQVLEMFSTVLNESIIKIQKIHLEFPSDSINDPEFTEDKLSKLFDAYKELPPLIEYANTEFKKIGKRFNNRVPLIDLTLQYKHTGQ